MIAVSCDREITLTKKDDDVEKNRHFHTQRSTLSQ